MVGIGKSRMKYSLEKSEKFAVNLIKFTITYGHLQNNYYHGDYPHCQRGFLLALSSEYIDIEFKPLAGIFENKRYVSYPSLKGTWINHLSFYGYNSIDTYIENKIHSFRGIPLHIRSFIKKYPWLNL